jgi:hypothetical protein
MSDLSHEHDRLHALVDEWIAAMEELEFDNARIDNAVIAAAVLGEREEVPVEGVFSRWTTTRVHVQMGVVRYMELYLEDQAKADD